MDDADDEVACFQSGYNTPPLSPSKSISTEEWLSPRTPMSPRKARSCLSLRDVSGVGFPQFPPFSPQKFDLESHFSTLQLAKFPRFSLNPASSRLDETSPIKKQTGNFDGPLIRQHIPCSLSNTHSSPILDDEPGDESREPLDRSQSPLSATSLNLNKAAGHDLGCSTNAVVRLIASPPPNSSLEAHTRPALTGTSTGDIDRSPNKLLRLPLRISSSPLRPSQWVARGGLLSSPHYQSRTPDRFIASRRPAHITRESFELNKPAERLTPQERMTRNGASSLDPFSRQLRRSGRLDEELRSLRETHSALTRRANLNRRTSLTPGARAISAGSVWNVGGSSAVSDTVQGVFDGRGSVLGSGTNAPLYTSMFLSGTDPDAELEAYERRLALALEVDQADRVLEHSAPRISPGSASLTSAPSPASCTTHVWKDNAWTKDGIVALLDAPQLRDDYYCSLLAYSHTAKYLAVGLGNFVHLWSEQKGVDTPESLNSLSATAATDVQHVTSLAFSSTEGAQAILAVGRADGRIALWSPFDLEPRFDATQPKPISCVTFRPTTVKRLSLRDCHITVQTEELLVGDESGHIYFYSVEWPSETNSALYGWNGAMTLLARITVHSQQICGLSWSTDGELFASGGNDNTCYLFETKKVLQNTNHNEPDNTINVRQGPNGESIYTVTPGRGVVLHIPSTIAKHRWEMNAAVKAIAFCPWQRGLLAVGGGSNDRCIHFYHTKSGACLATIDCAAQVTSLIWSQTRREIAATFGFAQPEHPYRIAVFAWPSCEQVVSVPWFDENRALYAISFPGGPDSGPNTGGRSAGEDGIWWRRTAEEGCIVVAASDAAIRFHEIWAGGKKSLGSGSGMLGGSDILESLHGIRREGESAIR